MAPSHDADGSEDVNDFLVRIRELGNKRDKEDEERTRKLEEEILQGRRERQARRAERARSISPTKDSPLQQQLDELIQRDSASSTPLSHSIQPPVDLVPSSLASRDSSGLPRRDSEVRQPETSPKQSSPDITKTSPLGGRPLSWKQRPMSRDQGSPTSTTLKPAREEEEKPATDTSTAGGADEMEEDAVVSRTQIAQSLGSKDPSFFKQTSDRGDGSRAYRRAHTSSFSEASTNQSSVKLPGLSREAVSDLSMRPASELGEERSRSPSRTSSVYGASSFGNRYSSVSSVTTAGLGSPVPLTSSRRHERASSIYEEQQTGDHLTMSPTQGRLASDNRPPSPTKGLGGFVQSAMLKRSDSVSKRWSAQLPVNTLRGGNTRPLPSPAMSPEGFSGLPSRPGSRPDSRPGSSHSDATVVRGEGDDASVISRSTDTYTRPPSRRRESVSTASGRDSGLPVSPSKTMDPRRWSPTKASWLESALSKPDSPKLKPRVPEEPEWKKDLTDRLRKAKELNQPEKTDTSESEKAVSAAGSKLDRPSSPEKLDSPPLKSPSDLKIHPPQETREPSSSPSPSEVRSPKDLTKSPPIPAKSEFLKSETKGSAPSPTQDTPSKPAAPGVKSSQIDFRGNLRRRETVDDSIRKDEPEFKAVFGKLRRAETKNYVAPDELKGNILRGKAGLTVTGGPKKTERVDEFKESLLKRKEAMKAAGGSIRPDHTGSANNQPPKDSTPEAILVRQNLGRSNSIRSTFGSKNPPAKPISKPAALRSPSSEEIPTEKENQPPQPLETPPTKSPIPSPPAEKETRAPTFAASTATVAAAAATSPINDAAPSPATKGKLGNRMNPMLANLIARGPPAPSKSASPASVSTISTSEPSTPEALTHMTKSRARGPKRRLPKGTTKESTPAAVKPNDPAPEKLYESSRLPSIETEPAATPKPLNLEVKHKHLTSNREENKPEVPLHSSLPSTPLIERQLSKPDLVAPNRSNSSPAENKDKPSPPPKSANLSTSPLNLKKQASVDDSPVPQKARPDFPSEKKPNQSEAKKPGLTDFTTLAPPRLGKPSFLSGLNTNRTREQSRSPSPTKTPAFAQSSEVSQMFSNFFLSRPTAEDKVEIDPASVMMSRPGTYPKIKTLAKQVWELAGDGKRKDLPGNQEYILFDESMYLCVHTFEKSSGGRATEVHLWCGDGVGEAAAEDTQLFARKVAREHNCKLELLKQGKETPNFIQALGGIMITRRGPSSRSNSSTQYMLCGRRHMGQIAFDEVDLSISNLCSGFTYIISGKNGKLFLWQGRGSTADEIGCARLIGMDIGLTGEIEEVAEGQEPSSFFESFPGQEKAVFPSADYWQLKPKHEKYSCRLYRIDHELGQWFGASFFNRRGASSPVSRPNDTVQEIEPFCQRDLDPAHIYVLDAFFEIYVIVGDRSNARSAEFASALVFAQEYGILAVSEQDRPFLPKSHVILEGLPTECKRAFRNWDGRHSPGTLNKAPIVVPLAVAIDAIR
ncbi:hypothetical protein MGYG_06989 [Nannizzia gypsea CBS 118893]|uniref:Gelsolin repeat protein n=1 Tax=Arthroderma gypseum (strain ATCC MYA-4604 / CBS 118893) TaxID=535722 RepID=E4V1S0_ARTGP|nr:hypothetical protein MGYG_06989 [Nannizzia gypsea CBS 118893]EFR03985.1 hypothetical protein MGYG_06989 [Nannizzia gypsea CBS 118893]